MCAGEKYAIGTLDKDKCTHFSVDITLTTDSIQISHTGESPVYVTGYRMQDFFPEDEDDYDMLEGEDFSSDEYSDESESSEEEEEDEEVPRAVPLTSGEKQKARAMIEEEADESDESESESEGSEDILNEDSSEEEDESSEEDESEEESEEDMVAGKRKIAGASKTPQPLKKTKSVRDAPGSAPAKVGQSGDELAYAKSLRAYLQQNGPSKLATLGQAVKRPANAPKSWKLKNFLNKHRDAFKYDGNTDVVSLAK